MLKIVRHSIFPDNPWGDGGAKRTAQISGILKTHGVKETLFPPYPEIGRSGKKKALIGGIKTIASFPDRPPVTRRLLSRFGLEFGYCENLFKGRKGQVFLWESTHLTHSNLFALGKKAGLKILAVPHNLESLVPEQKSFFSNKISPCWFNEELGILKQCDSVFTISREEQWLLRLNGIHAEYLPYYPPKEVENTFLKIGEKRCAKMRPQKSKELLLMGSFGNPPSRLGMLELIHAYHDISNQSTPPFKLHIVGYGTEQLPKYIRLSKGIILHGGVELMVMEKLLLNVDAVIAHQPATSGCLTKIPEMLLAGVPVLLNTNSARSWYGAPGVFVYETFSELFDLLQGNNVPDPARPKRNLQHEELFIRKILEMSA